MGFKVLFKDKSASQAHPFLFFTPLFSMGSSSQRSCLKCFDMTDSDSSNPQHFAAECAGLTWESKNLLQLHPETPLFFQLGACTAAQEHMAHHFRPKMLNRSAVGGSRACLLPAGLCLASDAQLGSGLPSSQDASTPPFIPHSLRHTGD